MSEQADDQEPKLIIDEDWKEKVQREKEQAAATEESVAPVAEDEDALGPLPPPTFEFLVSMLATQAIDAIGQMPGPDGKPSTVQKPVAKHLIELLGMIEEKTKGNLTSDEQKMLGSILHQLRMAFVSVPG